MLRTPRTFAYGEIAALARTLRAQGVDLQQLARAVDPGGSIPDAPATAAAPPADTSAALPSQRQQAQPQRQKQQAARPKTARVAQEGGGAPAGGTRGDQGVCGMVRAYLGTAIAHGLDNRDGAITAARRACR